MSEDHEVVRNLLPTYNINAPCKGCDDRKVGCHSVCDKYLNYKNKHDEMRELDRKSKHDRDQFIRIPKHKRLKKRYRYYDQTK